MKRTLIILTLVAAMLLQILPMAAFAEEAAVAEETAAEVVVEEVTEPEAAEPEVTEPETIEPEVTEPEATEPETTETEAEVPQQQDIEAVEVLDFSSYEDTAVTNPLYPELAGSTKAALVDNSYSGDPTEAQTVAAYTSVSAATDYMTSCMEQRKTRITFEIKLNYRLTQSTFDDLIDNIWYGAMEHNGIPTQGDYLYWHWSEYDPRYSTATNYTNGTSIVKADYIATYLTTASQEKDVTNKVNQLINSFAFTPATTDYEKAYTIYNWVTTNIRYDTADIYNHEPLAHSAYKGLIKGTCVCQGYASIIYRMYLMVGIPCRVVAGDGNGDHGWNIAQIAGKWYNLDATWDENVPSYNWDYFLKCPNNFTDHTRWSEYNTSAFHKAYPMASSDFNPSVYNGLIDVLPGYKGYYSNGFLQKNYTGFLQAGGKYYYVQNGVVDMNLTTLKESGGKWFFVENGVWNSKFTDLCYYNDTWFYVVNGAIDWTYTGLVPYNGNYFYVQNNVLDWSYTSLGYHAGNWYFIQNGLLQLDYTGLVYFNDNWFYVQNGLLTYDYFGMVEYQGNYFYVQASHLDWSYTGLGYHEGGWYFIQNALMQRNYTGFVEFNGEWFYVEQGVLTFQYTNLVYYNGSYFYVENSRIRWDYTGWLVLRGQTYYIENGVMRW